MKMRMLLWGVVLALAAWMTGCSSEDSTTADKTVDSSKLAARVNDWTLDREELNRILLSLPESDQLKYNTPGGKAELARRMIEEEMYHQEGLKLGLRDDENIKKRIATFTRSVIVAEYFAKNIKPLAVPDEQELHDYYEAHHDNYTSQPIVRAQHIFSTDREKLVGLRARIAEGEKMTTLAYKYSEDALTAGEGGDLGFFNPGGYVRGIGYSEELTEVAFELEPGIVSDPIKWAKGWSLLRVNEKRPSVLSTFESVRADIEGMFVARQIDHVTQLAYKELVNHYDTENFMEDEMKITQRTAEELWNLAQNSMDSYSRMRHYEEIVEKYPQGEYAAQAAFMVGFVYAEELKDLVEADRWFSRVLREYPASEIADQAKWMLDNLHQPAPDFKELGGSDNQG